MERTNEQWLTDLVSSDEGVQAVAIEDLRQRLQRGIFYYLSRERSDLASLSNHELTQMAEDLAQDAVLRVIENLETFRGDSLFTTWATRIAVRVAISDLRRARYKDYSLDDITADGELMPNVSALGAGVGGTRILGPERSAEQRDVMQRLLDAMRDGLTQRQYDALMAVAVNGVPLEVVAERMGTNRNALYKLIHDARRNLRNRMEEEGLSPEYVLNLFQE